MSDDIRQTIQRSTEASTAQIVQAPPASAGVQDHLRHAATAAWRAAEAPQTDTALMAHAQRSIATALERPAVVEALKSAGVEPSSVIHKTELGQANLSQIGDRLQAGARDQASYDKQAEVLSGFRQRGQLNDTSAHRDTVMDGSQLRRFEQDIRALATDMSRQVGQGPERNTALAVSIRNLEADSQRPGMVERNDFRSQVAHALKDLERTTGPVPNVPVALREEMTTRTAPTAEAQASLAGIQRVMETLKATAASAVAESPAPSPMAARLQSWRETEAAERAPKTAPAPVLETAAPSTGPSRQSSSSPSAGP